VYVLDSDGKLVGILSIKDIFRQPEHRKVGDICKKTSLVTIHPEADQEHAAYLALKNNLKALPVVDRDRHFLGVLPSDAILSILHRETHEDMLHSIGIHHRGVHHERALDSVLDIPVFQSIEHRVPWLGLGLLGGLAVAQIVGVFKYTLEENILLAGYIPLIIYMSGAVGMQTATFVVRDLAMGKGISWRRYFGKQCLATFLMAILFGVGFFLVAWALHRRLDMALVLGFSLIVAICSSILSGFFLPFLFQKHRVDPANATGPMGTIVQDVLGIVIYFSIATLLL
ncbi:magnesium transporter, partial [Candidatus Peregrinibacteria bacterium]|nr:magnesium transporter [Candidatus Peregrinibacteria bacterium]